MQQKRSREPLRGIIEGQDFRAKEIGNGPYPWHWEGLGDFKQWESDAGALTYEEACTNARSELATLILPELVDLADPTSVSFQQLIPRPELCPFELNGDFAIEQADDEHWHWEGLTGSVCEEFCSEDGLASERYAVADAIYQLSLLVDSCSEVEALTCVYHQALPIHQICAQEQRHAVYVQGQLQIVPIGMTEPEITHHLGTDDWDYFLSTDLPTADSEFAQLVPELLETMQRTDRMSIELRNCYPHS